MTSVTGDTTAWEQSPAAISNARALYEADEHAWLLQQIEALQTETLLGLDPVTLAEFLTDMAERDRREVRNRFKVLLHHLLKVKFQPERLTTGWLLTIVEQQDEIASILDKNHGMDRYLAQIYKEAYGSAVRLTSIKIGIPKAELPNVNPWSMQEALNFVPPQPKPRVGRVKK